MSDLPAGSVALDSHDVVVELHPDGLWRSTRYAVGPFPELREPAIVLHVGEGPARDVRDPCERGRMPPQPRTGAHYPQAAAQAITQTWAGLVEAHRARDPQWAAASQASLRRLYGHAAALGPQ